MKRFCLCVLCIACSTAVCFAQSGQGGSEMGNTGSGNEGLADIPAPGNPDSIYPAETLGSMLIHMSKITSPFKGSAPAIELLFSSDTFAWEACEPIGDWVNRIGQKNILKNLSRALRLFLILQTVLMMLPIIGLTASIRIMCRSMRTKRKPNS